MPLLVAASLVALEGVLLVAYGLAEMFAVSGSRVAMGVTTSVFFLLYGAALVFCAWSVSRLRSWARAPIVLAQLIQIPVVWDFRGGNTAVLVTGLVIAALVLAGIFHPASVQALASDRR